MSGQNPPPHDDSEPTRLGGQRPPVGPPGGQQPAGGWPQQPQQPQQGAWGQPQQPQQGGWGQPQPPQQSGWGQQAAGGYGGYPPAQGGQGGYGGYGGPGGPGGPGAGGFPPPPKKGKGMIIGAILGSMLLLIGAIVLIVTVTGGDDEPSDDPTAAESSSSEPTDEGSEAADPESSEAADPESSTAPTEEGDYSTIGEPASETFEPDESYEVGEICEPKGMENAAEYNPEDPKVQAYANSVANEDDFYGSYVGYGEDWQVDSNNYDEIQVAACLYAKPDTISEGTECTTEDLDEKEITITAKSVEYTIKYIVAKTGAQIGPESTLPRPSEEECPMFVIDDSDYIVPPDSEDIEDAIDDFVSAVN